MAEQDDFDELSFSLSDAEPSIPQQAAKPKKKYTMSEKAKQSRAANLAKGREMRLQKLAAKKQPVPKKQMKVYEDYADEYTDEYTDEYEDEYEPMPPPRPKQRAPPRERGHAPVRQQAQRRERQVREPKLTKAEMKMQDQLDRMQDLMVKLAKGGKRPSGHKTVIVNPAPTYQQQPPSENKVKSKEELYKKLQF